MKQRFSWQARLVDLKRIQDLYPGNRRVEGGF
jgi:hypothetical protein